MRPNRTVYISLFVFLGFISQFLIHGVVEVTYIKLLRSDFERYGLGLSWNNWFLIHHISSLILLSAGFIWGYLRGKYCYKKLYSNPK